jgi:hypothetical protein
MGGGNAMVWRYARLAMVASWKTMRRLVSSLHLILKPPLTDSHSEKTCWMSFVLSSFGNPVRERMRVTEAERLDNAAAIDRATISRTVGSDY